jgi:hypothetical protein
MGPLGSAKVSWVLDNRRLTSDYLGGLAVFAPGALAKSARSLLATARVPALSQGATSG